MLNVQKHLQTNPLSSLSESPLYIEVKDYPEQGIATFNYSQIDSPKDHPITNECRGLILETTSGEFNIVAKSFNRFFNFGEREYHKHYDISKATVYTKIDGSLMTAYNYNNQWHVSTRKMAFAEGQTSFGKTYREVFDMAFDISLLNKFNDDCCFVFELVSPYNRIVTPYPQCKVYLLSIVNRRTHTELPQVQIHNVAKELGVDIPQVFSLGSFDDALKAADALPALEEGYVCHWGHDNSRIKIKNPSYVAIAHLRDNGALSDKRVIKLVVSGDEEEYLSYFPEDRHVFEPYILGFKKAVQDIHTTWEGVKGIELQKDYALKVKDLPCSAILFSMRKGNTFQESLDRFSEDSQVNLVKSYMD